MTVPRSEVVVVGAGLVGLAVARALLQRRRRSLLLVEAEGRVAAHQSGHNSGVLHSGLYYRPGSLKAQLCARGRARMEEYCRERSVRFERCGKVVVATRDAQREKLGELLRRAHANGLEGVVELDADGVRAREPAVTGAVAGLWVPETGIVDFPGVAAALRDDVAALGGEVRLGAPLRAASRADGGHRLRVGDAEVHADYVVNCAGLQADRVARRCGVDPVLRIVPFRGEYKLLRRDRRDLVRGLIYPVPDPRFPFLGVHYTRRIDGAVEAGPNAVLALSRHGYRWRDVSVRDLLAMASYGGFWRMAARYWRTGSGEVWRSLSHRAFTRALQELTPAVRADDLERGGSGVRAQVVDRDGGIADDFRIVRDATSLHVLSAPSPAATACLAIAEHLVAEIEGAPQPAAAAR